MSAGEICKAIDGDLITFIHTIVNIIKLGVPLILVILGMLDFGKGVLASKEDEIKKGQQIFLKRLIAAVLVFLTFAIVQFVFKIIPGEDSQIIQCADQILNGNTKQTKDK